MSVDFKKFDIGMDDNGYLLQPQTYQKAPIQFFAQQQAEGEQSLADASVYKFFSQTDWTGGYDEDEMTAPNVFSDSKNIDINRVGGEIKLSRIFKGNRLTNGADLVTTADSSTITSAADDFVTDALVQGDKIRINSGVDKGEYTIQSITDLNTLVLTTTLTANSTDVLPSGTLDYVVYQDHPCLPVTTTTEILDDSEDEIDLTSITGLPTNGTIRINGEEISYTGITTLTLTGCTRGINSTTAQAHISGVNVETVQEVIDQVVFNNVFVVAIGKFIFTSSDAATWTKSLTASANISDLAISQGVLVAAAGTDGFHWSKSGTSFTGSAGGNDATNSSYLLTHDIGGSEQLLICNGSVFSRATYTTGAPGSWTITIIKTLSVDESNFLLKPVFFRGNVYAWANRGSETLGRADLYVYDGTTFEKYLSDTQYPKARRMFARENEIIYAEDQGDGVAIKSFNGSSVKTLKKIESAEGGTQWNTVQYNTTQYGAGSELITSPFYGVEFEDRFMFSLKSTSATNYLHTYEGQDSNGKDSFSRILQLDDVGSNYASFGTFQKTIWTGDTKGRLRKLQNEFSASGELTSSNIDVNLPNLQKLWVNMEVIHKPLPSETSMTVKVIDDGGSEYSATLDATTGGTGSSVSKFTFKNVAIPAIQYGLLTKKLTYKITLNGIPSKSPSIKDVNMRYYVQNDEKNRWKIGVLCLDSMELLDETENSLTGAQTIDALEVTLAKNTMITFEDIDQTSYDVLIDNNRPPVKTNWIEPETGNEMAIFTINLLEA